MPIPRKDEAIQALAVPKTRKQLCHFIGRINFYRDMWKKRSEIIAPLTALTSKNVKYEWKDEHQKCFDAITRLIASKRFWCLSLQSYLTFLEVMQLMGREDQSAFAACHGRI